MAKPSKDNRRAQRDRHDSVLEVYDVSGKHIAWTGKLVDFSDIGVAFSTTKLLTKGERIHARLRILEKGTLEIHGRVVRVRTRTNTNLYGVEFDSVTKVYPTGEIKKTWLSGP